LEVLDFLTQETHDYDYDYDNNYDACTALVLLF
jgi:hypothetical protein